MKTYALTIKKTRKPITLGSYEDYLTWLATKCGVANVNYEDTRGLHLHCVIRAPDDFEFKDLKMVPYGWSFKMVPVYNLAGWINYAEKDSSKRVKEQQMLQEAYENDPRVTYSYIPDYYPHKTWSAPSDIQHEVAPKGEPSDEEIIDTNVLHKPHDTLSDIEPTPMDYYKNGLDIRKNYKK